MIKIEMMKKHFNEELVVTKEDNENFKNSINCWICDNDHVDNDVKLRVFFFYNIINHKHILTKYYNHQEHTYCYLGGYKNTMLEQKLLEQITKIKILKEKRKIKR